MKKLVLFAAVALSMSVFSCGKGEKAEATDSVAADTTEVVEAAADTVAADTVATDTVAPQA